jgi:hypothetical protein
MLSLRGPSPAALASHLNFDELHENFSPLGRSQNENKLIQAAAFERFLAVTVFRL